MDKIEELKVKVKNAFLELDNKYKNIDVDIRIEMLRFGGEIAEFYQIDVVYKDLFIRQCLTTNAAEDDGIINDVALLMQQEFDYYEKEKKKE